MIASAQSSVGIHDARGHFDRMYMVAQNSIKPLQKCQKSHWKLAMRVDFQSNLTVNNDSVAVFETATWA